MATARTADNQFGGQDHVMALRGELAVGDALEEKVGGHLSDLINRLAHHSERELEHVGDVQVIEAGGRDLAGHIDAKCVHGMQQATHGEVVAGEERGGRLGPGEQGVHQTDNVVLGGDLVSAMVVLRP